MSGFETWVPIATMVSLIPFVKAEPEQILKSMMALWLRPDGGDYDRSEQSNFQNLTQFAKSTGNCTFRTVPMDDPYWQSVGVDPEDYQQQS